MNSLRGRIEKARITQKTGTNDGVGKLITPYEREGEIVHVSNASEFRGRDVLIRFDLYSRPDRRSPTTNFISTNIPDNFQGIAPEDFVLIGLWDDKKMACGNHYPTLREVNRFYDPGKAGIALFVENPEKVILCHPRATKRFEFNLDHYNLQKYLPDPNNNSRLMIANSLESLYFVKGLIHEAKLKPVEMTPLP